jgi:hypothetical protein
VYCVAMTRNGGRSAVPRARNCRTRVRASMGGLRS